MRVLNRRINSIGAASDGVENIGAQLGLAGVELGRRDGLVQGGLQARHITNGVSVDRVGLAVQGFADARHVVDGALIEQNQLAQGHRVGARGHGDLDGELLAVVVVHRDVERARLHVDGGLAVGQGHNAGVRANNVALDACAHGRYFEGDGVTGHRLVQHVVNVNE